METTSENTSSKNSETVSDIVSDKKPKQTRKFTWTDKRKAQFEKMRASNREKSKDKNRKSGKSKESKEEEEELEDQKGLEKEEQQSKNIVKRIMDPHYLSRKDRHTIGTTSDCSSEDSDNSSESDSDKSSSSSDSSVEIKKKVIKKPKITKTDWKLTYEKLKKLKAKNKQLQELFLHKSNRKNKYSTDNQSEDSEKEENHYSNTPVPIKSSTPIYFC